jgi:hypothetical protein
MQTPNDIVDFYKRHNCPICGSELLCDQETISIDKEYTSFADCPNDHYQLDLEFSDPKVIIDYTETFVFYSKKSKEYRITHRLLEGYITIQISDGAGSYNDFYCPKSYINLSVFDRKVWLDKISKILLLQ